MTAPEQLAPLESEVEKLMRDALLRISLNVYGDRKPQEIAGDALHAVWKLESALEQGEGS